MNSSRPPSQAKARAEREEAARKIAEERAAEEKRLEQARKKAEAEARYAGSMG